MTSWAFEELAKCGSAVAVKTRSITDTKHVPGRVGAAGQIGARLIFRLGAAPLPDQGQAFGVSTLSKFAAPWSRGAMEIFIRRLGPGDNAVLASLAHEDAAFDLDDLHIKYNNYLMFLSSP